jgi:pheromone a factor receptor
VSVGIPAASLCINRRLYLIASVQSVTTTKAEKRRAVYVDLAIGLGIPLAEMILRTCIRDMNFNCHSPSLEQNLLCKGIVSISSRMLAAGQ